MNNRASFGNNMPFISVIVLNYFGEKIIADVIESLEKLNYPKNRYEIIIVDNNSKDGSIGILRKLEDKFDNIRLILSKLNTGFAKGNNLGIKEAKGDYIILLNNDCIVENDWLMNLVKTALRNPKTFAVNSKILLYPKYLNLEFSTDQYLIPQYSWLSDSKLYNFAEKKMYLTLHKKEAAFQTEIPFDPYKDSKIELYLVFNCGNDIKSRNLKEMIKFNTEGVEIFEYKAAKNEVAYNIHIDLKNPEIKKYVFSKIQNAGIMPFQDGYARDIGGIVKDSRQYYEHEKGQFNEEKEVYAACGAAILMDRQILESLGYLDESFFMYYEDVEISERAKLRGYKNYYSPKAEVRHLHALSSKEGSNFFVFQVEKARLLHVFYNFPINVFFDEIVKMFLIIIYGLAKAVFHLRHLRSFSKKPVNEKPSYKIKLQKIYVLFYFLTCIFWLSFLKYKKHRGLVRTAITNNYKEILSGRWYFD